MNNIEYHTYLLNLPRSKDRLEKVTPKLDETGIKYEVFVATDGKDIDITNLKTKETKSGLVYKQNKEKTKVKVPYSIKCDPTNTLDDTSFTFHSKQRKAVPGELGIWCSYIRLWKDAIDHGYKQVILFEDDINIKESLLLKDKINNFINHLPETFDVGFLSYKIGFGKVKKLNDVLNISDENSYYFGTWAIIFSEKGMKKLIDQKTYNDFIDEFIIRNDYNKLSHKNEYLKLENYYSNYEDFLWSGDTVIGSEMGRF